MKYTDLFPKDLAPQRIYCSECNSNMYLDYGLFDEMVEDIKILVDEVPYLMCPNCKAQYLPDRSRTALMMIFEEAKKENKKSYYSRRRKSSKKFNLGKVEFIYDADDYFYIPGLNRGEQDGFLTPVFFNKSVLMKFYNWPRYNVSFASRTYGDIGKGSDYSIAFGINEDDRVVMWLGDIATLPEEEQHYLRSENIPSDHKIGSEFYDGQIEAKFTDRTPEDELVRSWSAMHSAFLKKYNEKSSHLDDESVDLIKDIKRPAIFTQKENKNIIDILNKFCIETLNNSVFSKLLKGLGETEIDKGSLKRLQKLFEITFPDKNIADMLCPLFVLYDLRISYLHLTSDDTQKETIASALSRLGMASKTDFESLYDELIKQITNLYTILAKLLES